MAAKITYTDKAQGQTSGFPTNQTWSFEDPNEIKTVVNNNADETDLNTASIATNTSNIATNVSNISDNASDIVVLEESKLDNRIVVTTANLASTLGGTIDSTKEYFIDGVVDFTGTGLSVAVPVGGIEIAGYSFNTSKILCTDASYTLFNSAGSGSMIFKGVSLDISGSSSKVFDIKGSTGDESIEFMAVNFDNCSSLGVVDGYRQGLEENTGRFGGTPELTLEGTWSGGYRTSLSIVRGLADGAYSLYKAGGAFSMESRFKIGQNLDLPASASFLDFSSSNFMNSSTLQIQDCIISRNGVFDAEDANLTPNITQSELSSSWINNKGLNNTFVGGEGTITTEVTTTISSVGVFVDVAGTNTYTELEHFDSPANGQLRHLGDSPREFKVVVNYILDSNPNNELDLKLVVWDDSASVFVDYRSVKRVVNNLQGGRDVAYFTFQDHAIMDENDYVKLQVANATNTNNITAELDSIIDVEER